MDATDVVVLGATEVVVEGAAEVVVVGATLKVGIEVTGEGAALGVSAGTVGVGIPVVAGGWVTGVVGTRVTDVTEMGAIVLVAFLVGPFLRALSAMSRFCRFNSTQKRRDTWRTAL